nr:hypothetical protein [Dehalococcoidia bacterium]
LSDAAVKSLSGYDPENAGIYLVGLTKLSDAALEMFVACDLTIEYGDESYFDQCNTRNRKGRLALHPSFEKQAARISKARKKEEKVPRAKSTPLESVLTNDQLVKLQRLIDSKKAENISLAINLLKSLDAMADWDLIFPSSAISLLVNTWDIDVWNAVAEGLESNQKRFDEFQKLLVTRFSRISIKEMRLAGIECRAYSESSEKQQLFLAATINQIAGSLAPVFREVVVESNGLQDLDMSNLQSISETGASILSKCNLIDLSGLTTISENAAEHLRSVANLDLSGLATWSDRTAQILSETNGEWLKLSGLKTLTAPAARSLSQYRGVLNLSGLKKLTAEAAESLSKYEGLIVVSSLSIVWDAKK